MKIAAQRTRAAMEAHCRKRRDPTSDRGEEQCDPRKVSLIYHDSGNGLEVEASATNGNQLGLL